MKEEIFEKFKDGFLGYMSDTLGTKKREYAFRDDRLSNFKDVGELNGISPEMALFVLMSKHIVSVKDFISEIEATGETTRPLSQWIEKIGDIAIYSVLLMALIEERIGHPDPHLQDPPINLQ